MKKKRKFLSNIERQHAKFDGGWFNWFLDRGRLYGSGKMLRKGLRQISWRRAL